MSKDKQHLETLAELREAEAERDLWRQLHDSKAVECDHWRRRYEELRGQVRAIARGPAPETSVKDGHTPAILKLTVEQVVGDWRSIPGTGGPD